MAKPAICFDCEVGARAAAAPTLKIFRRGGKTRHCENCGHHLKESSRPEATRRRSKYSAHDLGSNASGIGHAVRKSDARIKFQREKSRNLTGRDRSGKSPAMDLGASAAGRRLHPCRAPSGARISYGPSLNPPASHGIFARQSLGEGGRILDDCP